MLLGRVLPIIFESLGLAEYIRLTLSRYSRPVVCYPFIRRSGQVMREPVPRANPSAMKHLMLAILLDIHTSKCLTLDSLLFASSLSVVRSIPPSCFDRVRA